jgi:hypothetical protein
MASSCKKVISRFLRKSQKFRQISGLLLKGVLLVNLTGESLSFLHNSLSFLGIIPKVRIFSSLV